MRTFADIQRELNLVRYVGSFSGNLYIVPVAPSAPRIVVRHFDRDLPPSLIPSYTALLRAAQSWIDTDPELAKLVRVEQPVETGSDFIARPHHLGTALSAYEDDEDPPEAPEELNAVRTRFRARAAQARGERERLLADVLARSLLQPTAKTVFNAREHRFVIADLKPTRDDLERWNMIERANNG
jgi:hypothetical protein